MVELVRGGKVRQKDICEHLQKNFLAEAKASFVWSTSDKSTRTRGSATSIPGSSWRDGRRRRIGRLLPPHYCSC